MVRPVYVFSGFLDSGKTRSMKTSLLDERFNQGEYTLIICFEQGDEEYDDVFLKQTHSDVVYLDTIDDLTIYKQEELNREYDPDRIFIELNGMEDDNLLYQNGFCKEWELAQTLVTIDASKFSLYMNNMRQFMYNHVINSECAIVNRADDIDKKYLRNNLKSINQRLELIFEDKNGNISTIVNEDLFDTSKDLFIEDIDYGLWYMDAVDNADKYDNVRITLKIKKCHDDHINPGVTVMGRRAMVCCANDIQEIALSVVGCEKFNIEENKYYYVSGIIHSLRDEENYKVCVLYADDVKEAVPPEVDLVNFN